MSRHFHILHFYVRNFQHPSPEVTNVDVDWTSLEQLMCATYTWFHSFEIC